MRKINESFQFPIFFDLLTPKEKKDSKDIITSKLQRVKKRVNLGQFGFYLTRLIPAASIFHYFFDALYMFDIQLYTRVLKICASTLGQSYFSN